MTGPGRFDDRDERDGGRFDGRDDEHDVFEVRRGQGSRALSFPEALSPRMRRRRAWTLVLLTLVAPGSAQLAAGHRRFGSAALRVWAGILVLLAAVAALFFVRRSWVIGLLANPTFLLVAAVALGVAALVWAILFLDALRLARLRLVGPPANRWLAAVTAVLVVCTSGTLAFAASNVFAGRDAVTGVFGGHTVRDADHGRYNILLMGGDSGADRSGTRPDTIMLASVDADTGKTVLFGFARDTENITFKPGSTMARLLPQGWNCGDECLLNALYQFGEQHKNEFPAGTQDAGAEATREAVESLSGLDVQYYALVNLKGFQRFVDAVGGVTIDVKKRTAIGGETSPIKGYIEPGVQTLDGYHALWYARSRAQTSNYDRMARQRCVLTAMLHQLTPETVILKFKDIAAVSGSVLETDVPDADLGTLGDLAMKAKSQKITSVNFVPPLINPWKYDPQFVKDRVAAAITASEKSENSEKSSAGSTADAPAPSAPSTAKKRSGSTPSSAPTTSSSTTSGDAGDSGSKESTGDLSSVCSAA